MPDTTKKTYKVTPADGSEPYTVQGTEYTFDAPSGRHAIKDGDELVASLINVSVVKQSA